MRRLLLLALLSPAPAPLRLRELEELKRFYNVTSGADWTVNTNWDLAANSQCGFVDNSIPPGWPYYAPEQPLPGGPACIYKDPCDTYTKWYGVGCVDPCYAPTDGDNCVFGRVTMLSLRQNSLAGTIPDSFFDELINMTIVELAQNSLSGTIPSTIGKVRNLRTWDFAENRFSGSIPSEIATMGSAYGLGYGPGGLEGLTYISLAHNNLTGIVPSEIGYLENLQYIDMSDNPNLGFPEGGNLNLNPGLPTEIGMLGALGVFKLDHCGFSGTVPTEIGELTSVRDLLFRGTTLGLQPITNRFSGTIPTEVGKLDKLINFGFNDNRISGSIPPEIGGMADMERFYMQENFLSGTMPDVFGGLPKIELWDTYGNFITGDLPESIQNATQMNYLYVQIEQTDVMRQSHCQERIPGLGTIADRNNIPSRQPGLKINWFIQVADYFKDKYTTACPNMWDPHTAFEALSGDV